MTSATKEIETMSGETAIPANQPNPAHVAMVGQQEQLTVIAQPAINLAIWHRPIAQGLIGFLDSLPETKLPQESRTVATIQARAAVAGFVAQIWPEPTLGRQLLCHDISNLVELFADRTGARRVRITLDNRREAQATGFAAAPFRMRLETTYRGPSLEWLPEDAVDREMLETANDDLICDDASAVRALSRFHVALIKGEALPRNAGKGLVFRQPAGPQPYDGALTLRLDEDS